MTKRSESKFKCWFKSLILLTALTSALNFSGLQTSNLHNEDIELDSC